MAISNLKLSAEATEPSLYAIDVEQRIQKAFKRTIERLKVV